MRYVIAWLVLCAAAPVQATPPPSFSASYTVHKGRLLLGGVPRTISKEEGAGE